MGMFDYLQIPSEFLPKDMPEWVSELDQTVMSNAFQTKDLDNFLHLYELTKEGKLLMTRRNFDGLFFSDEPANEPEPVDYTGVINDIASRYRDAKGWEFYEATLLIYRGEFVASLPGRVSSENIIERLISAMLDERGTIGLTIYFVRDFVENPR